MDPCELHEVQEGQVQVPAHVSGQSPVSIGIGGVRAALQRSALGYCWMTTGTRAGNIHLLPRLHLGLHNKEGGQQEQAGGPLPLHFFDHIDCQRTGTSLP